MTRAQVQAAVIAALPTIGLIVHALAPTFNPGTPGAIICVAVIGLIGAFEPSLSTNRNVAAVAAVVAKKETP
jgi:hypothetical protein